MSKRGNSRLRGLLYMAGLVVIGTDEHLKQQFDGYKNRCGSGKKAVNVLAYTIARRCY